MRRIWSLRTIAPGSVCPARISSWAWRFLKLNDERSHVLNEQHRASACRLGVQTVVVPDLLVDLVDDRVQRKSLYFLTLQRTWHRNSGVESPHAGPLTSSGSYSGRNAFEVIARISPTAPIASIMSASRNILSRGPPSLVP